MNPHHTPDDRTGPAAMVTGPARLAQRAVQGIDICIRIRTVSDLVVLPAPPVAVATAETVSPASTPGGRHPDV